MSPTVKISLTSKFYFERVVIDGYLNIELNTTSRVHERMKSALQSGYFLWWHFNKKFPLKYKKQTVRKKKKNIDLNGKQLKVTLIIMC